MRHAKNCLWDFYLLSVAKNFRNTHQLLKEASYFCRAIFVNIVQIYTEEIQFAFFTHTFFSNKISNTFSGHNDNILIQVLNELQFKSVY